MIQIYKKPGVRSTTTRSSEVIVSSGEEVLFSLDAETLAGADLHSADLRWANLVGADLRTADLSGAQFVGADLSNADLTGANLRNAELSGCKLRRANLCGACLADSRLIIAWLEGADLTACDLEGANLRYCRYNSDTKWPAGPDPVARGAGPSAARRRYEQRVRESRSSPESESETGLQD